MSSSNGSRCGSNSDSRQDGSRSHDVAIREEFNHVGSRRLKNAFAWPGRFLKSLHPLSRACSFQLFLFDFLPLG